MPQARQRPCAVALAMRVKARASASPQASVGSGREASGLWRKTRSGVRPRSRLVCSSAARSRVGSRECSAVSGPGK